MSSCFIKEYSNLLDEEKLNKISVFCQKACEPAGLAGGPGLENNVNTNVRNALVACTSEKDESFLKTYAGLLWDISKEYVKDSDSSPFDERFYHDHFKIESISFLKYKPGYFYKLHSDESILVPCQSDFFRELSFIFFVNENYSGGHVSFPKQGKIIKPEANKLVIFPSNWCFPHEVLPVTRGTRYTAVTWGGRIT